MTFFKRDTPVPERTVQPIHAPVNRPAERGSRSVAGYQFVESVKKQIRPKSGRELDRSPNGVLFKMKTGWFDEDGYWCVWNGKPGGTSIVYRNCPRKISLMMSPDEKKMLGRARNKSKKNGRRE